MGGKPTQAPQETTYGGAGCRDYDDFFHNATSSNVYVAYFQVMEKVMENVLGKEPSPYLRQHKNNPIHWQVWGEEAIQQAQKSNKPIMLSSGYAACHWCHVMAAESFSDPKIARLVNKHFIAIKVDREEHPDVDIVYQTALQAMGQQGGWPLTMFLTPQTKQASKG